MRRNRHKLTGPGRIAEDSTQVIEGCCEEIANLMKQENERWIRSYYAMGEILYRKYETAVKAAKREKRKLPYTAFVRFVQHGLAQRGHVDYTQGWLKQCSRVAISLSDDEIDELAKGGTITPAHFCMLAGLNEEHRRMLLGRIVAERLSLAQLQRELVKLIGPLERPKRRIDSPKNLLLPLWKLQADTERWQKAFWNSCFTTYDWSHVLSLGASDK